MASVVRTPYLPACFAVLPRDTSSSWRPSVDSYRLHTRSLPPQGEAASLEATGRTASALLAFCTAAAAGAACKTRSRPSGLRKRRNLVIKAAAGDDAGARAEAERFEQAAAQLRAEAAELEAEAPPVEEDRRAHADTGEAEKTSRADDKKSVSASRSESASPTVSLPAESSNPLVCVLAAFVYVVPLLDGLQYCVPLAQPLQYADLPWAVQIFEGSIILQDLETTWFGDAKDIFFIFLFLSFIRDIPLPRLLRFSMQQSACLDFVFLAPVMVTQNSSISLPTEAALVVVAFTVVAISYSMVLTALGHEPEALGVVSRFLKSKLAPS
eukprot:TRINITY_DN41562_c0_g1_i2.p1 TRINITY_DN41562_c0_g1~~TRINITY_DN41562_c0_g1_i2.p1  ORF type:complete len:341 (-),score=71.53 TRINITY_DN41562_c0_g1_i2:518-1495(-)